MTPLFLSSSARLLRRVDQSLSISVVRSSENLTLLESSSFQLPLMSSTDIWLLVALRLLAIRSTMLVEMSCTSDLIVLARLLRMMSESAFDRALGFLLLPSVTSSSSESFSALSRPRRLRSSIFPE
ncbi:hypothetical protein D3C78_1384560 [compost metagenome]